MKKALLRGAAAGVAVAVLARESGKLRNRCGEEGAEGE